MNDLNKQNAGIEKTSLTPIEIALGIDEEGRTTAKKLYDFLELNPTHYSKWTKRNISENGFAIETEDYEVLAIECENPQGGRPSQDYKLSASFAKKLAMGTHNEKGEAAKNYFVKVEEKLKEVAMQPQKQLSPMDQLKLQYQVLEDHEQKIDGVIERVDKIENNTTIDYSQQQELNELANKKVVAVLGGKETPAYRELAKKAFRSFWHDYKNKLNVNSYRNTLVKDFGIGRQAIINWQPSRELELMIKGCNTAI
jgi:anti-repressor protein